MDSGCHKLSGNIWFVWSKRSYSGHKVGCDDCDGRTDGNVKIELESSKQDSQFWVPQRPSKPPGGKNDPHWLAKAKFGPDAPHAPHLHHLSDSVNPITSRGKAL